MRKVMVLWNPAPVAAALVLALLTALLAGCSQPTDPDPKSSDATLKSLSIATGETSWSLSPAFNADETVYTANVPTETESVVITAVANHKAATVVLGDGTLNAAGETTPVYVDVTAEDGETKERYVITIHRAAPDDGTNNNLGSLTVSSGTLTPPFSAAVTVYNLRLPFATESVVIEAVAADSATAILTGDGTKTLEVGETVCEVTVTAQSGDEKTYTITILREMDARLATLSVAPHTLTPAFDPDTTAYTVSELAYEVTALPLEYTAKTPDATVTVTGNTLSQGDNIVSLVVQTTDGTEKTYTLSVAKAGNPGGSSDNALKSLSLGPAPGSHESNLPVLSPAFDPDTLIYTATGWTNGEHIIIDAAANEEHAVVGGAGTQSLNVGDNALSLTVTAENGDVRTYTINVRRQNNDAGYASITIVHSGSPYNILWEGRDAVLLNPPSGTSNPDGSIGWHITSGYGRSGQINTQGGIKFTPADGASVTAGTKQLPGDAAPSALAPINGNEYVIDPLQEGESSIALTVTAEDGITTQVYAFRITHTLPPSTDGTLKSITVTGGSLNPEFDPAITSYTVFVSDVTSITVTVEKNDPKAILEDHDAGEPGKRTVTLSGLVAGTPRNAAFKVTPEVESYEKTYVVTALLTTGGGPDTVWENLQELTAWLLQLPENEPPANPYSVKLGSAINFAGLQSQNNRPLVNLATALNNAGRYVTVDLSAFTDTPGNANSGGSSATDGRAFLVGVTLPSTITAIPNYFFANCKNLTSFDWSKYPNLTTINQYAFQNTGFTSLTLPSNIASIGTMAFGSSTALVTADLSAVPVSAFNAGWFSSCGALQTVTLPQSATSVSGSFSIGGLRRVVIPAGMTTMDALFTATFRPVDFTFELAPENTTYSAILDGKALIKLGEGSAKTLLFYPSARGAVTDIPNDITGIGSIAFRSSPITSISIPNSVTAIGANAFTSCAELTSVTFGSGLMEIPNYAFSNCAKLTGVITIPATTIGTGAFQNAGTVSGFSVILSGNITTITDAFSESGLTAINIPATVTSIADFYNCTRLTAIDFSQATGLTAVPAMAFYGCTQLATVTLPPNLTSLGYNAFYNCKALTQIDLPATLTFVGDPDDTRGSAFYGSGLTSVTLPPSVTTVCPSVFGNCADLVWVKILNTDGLVTLLTNNFPFTKGTNSYPFIYVPDELYTKYAGDAEVDPPVVSEWTNCPAGARPFIRRLSQFATDYPGQ
jgi:hypothetical protein